MQGQKACPCLQNSPKQPVPLRDHHILCNLCPFLPKCTDSMPVMHAYAATASGPHRLCLLHTRNMRSQRSGT